MFVEEHADVHSKLTVCIIFVYILCVFLMMVFFMC